jgi:hypothetical protein
MRKRFGIKTHTIIAYINDKRPPTTHGGGKMEMGGIEPPCPTISSITSTRLSGKARVRKIGLEPISGSDSGACLPIGTY